MNLNLGGHEFEIQCEVVLECPPHYLGKEHEARNTEHFMKYLVNNEILGHGICEWNYRNTRVIPHNELKHL